MSTGTLSFKVIDKPKNEWDHLNYPGPGVYLHSDSLWFVYNSYVQQTFSVDDEIRHCFVMPGEAPKAVSESSGFDQDILLKAIAVSQKPELAFS